MNLNGYEQYKQQSINTMTKGELLLLLYDEMLKRLKRAELMLDTQNIRVFNESVDRCVQITRYLQQTLNQNYPISNDLNKIYDFWLYELSRLKAGRRKQTIVELRPFIEEMRSAFDEASKRAPERG